MRGIIKKKTEKRFGFISLEDGSKDIFFHLTKLENVGFNELNEGDEVEFDTVETDRGKVAVKVNLV